MFPICTSLSVFAHVLVRTRICASDDEVLRCRSSNCCGSSVFFKAHEICQSTSKKILKQANGHGNRLAWTSCIEGHSLFCMVSNTSGLTHVNLEILLTSLIKQFGSRMRKPF